MVGEIHIYNTQQSPEGGFLSVSDTHRTVHNTREHFLLSLRCTQQHIQSCNESKAEGVPATTSMCSAQNFEGVMASESTLFLSTSEHPDSFQLDKAVRVRAKNAPN